MDAVHVCGCKRKQIALQLIKQNQSNSCRKNGPANTPKSRALIFNKNAMGHLKPRVHLFSKHAEIGSNLSYGKYIDQINPKSFRKFLRQIIGLKASKGFMSFFKSFSECFINFHFSAGYSLTSCLRCYKLSFSDKWVTSKPDPPLSLLTSSRCWQLLRFPGVATLQGLQWWPSKVATQWRQGPVVKVHDERGFCWEYRGVCSCGKKKTTRFPLLYILMTGNWQLEGTNIKLNNVWERLPVFRHGQARLSPQSLALDYAGRDLELPQHQAEMMISFDSIWHMMRSCVSTSDICKWQRVTHPTVKET